MGSIGKGLAFTLGMGQLLVLVGVVMFYPNVTIEAFVYTPPVRNGTLWVGEGAPPGATRPLQLALGLVCLMTGASSAAFVHSTFNLMDSGALSSQTYSREGLAEAGPWNALFWFTVACVHAVVVCVVTTPVDLFAGCACTYLLVHFLHRLCAPIEEGSPLLIANPNVVGYILGFAGTMYCTPQGYSHRLALLFVLGALDYALLIGHTWDRSPDRTPDMETVGNCRLFWVCCAGLCLAGLYGAWHDRVLLQAVK